jgi:hypothetical protein
VIGIHKSGYPGCFVRFWSAHHILQGSVWEDYGKTWQTGCSWEAFGNSPYDQEVYGTCSGCLGFTVRLWHVYGMLYPVPTDFPYLMGRVQDVWDSRYDYDMCMGCYIQFPRTSLTLWDVFRMSGIHDTIMICVWDVISSSHGLPLHHGTLIGCTRTYTGRIGTGQDLYGTIGTCMGRLGTWQDD